ncbi:50S ribosomal protein L17, chloroplastic [Porphyridium purpureum]|uniref:Large ribosomal subunit protein bL17c n=1 Tax=Porphyridium purpureum TaxID=35688 RepID=A0A5J4Z7R9_PORPP|nr:50S ribosomal protein L17, chloroplastic [Porphyridium purpureum]|eukprot:POR2280..scf295_1
MAGLGFVSGFFGTKAVATPVDAPRATCGAAAPMTMMRHGVRGRKLNKPADQRKAMLRALTTELIRHGSITTTLARCKEVRKTADHMITLAKDNSLHARRQALAYIYDKELVSALFDGVPERYADRNGGYTRVQRTMPRKGDNAPMGQISLV